MNEEKYKNWLHINDEESRSVNKEVYLIYYNEGKQAFLESLDPTTENNPYGLKYPKNPNQDTFYRAYPWFDGFRDASKDYFNNKYKLDEMQETIKQVIKNYGLELKYEDEYGYPYCKTPEGYTINLC